MGLKLKLQPGERLVVNGCVIRNGDRATKIEIENRADVLRGNEILDVEDCQTPVLRIQHEIQIALVSPDLRSELVPGIFKRIDEISDIMSDAVRSQIASARRSVAEGEFYAAYKHLEAVAEREQILLSVPLGPVTH